MNHAKRALRLTALAALMLLGITAVASAADTKAAKKPPVPKVLRTWSYLGPLGALVGARVTLKDATGRVVGRGTTHSTGTYSFNLKGKGALKLPLTVTTSGGTVRGKSFRGHLRARAFGFDAHTEIVQISPISTAASHMSASASAAAYAAATRKVRSTLGISKGALPEVLRIKNSEVGFVPLVAAAHRHGGFDQFAVDLAKLATAGKKLGSLRPGWAKSRLKAKRSTRGSGTDYAPASGITTTASTYDSPMCNASLPSTSNSAAIIDDTLTIGAGVLAKYAGAPSTAVAGVTGMLLGPLGLPTQSSPDAAALNAVMNDLNCISAQLNYLISEVDELQLTVDLSAVTTCQADVTTAYSEYEYISQDQPTFQGAIDDGTLNLYAGKGGDWSNVQSDCSSNINSMLFSTFGGENPAWTTFVKNTLGSTKWYTQTQQQELQQFLGYWGMVEYQQFIIVSEFDNYNGTLTDIQNASGTVWDTSTIPATGPILNSAGQATCRSNLTSSSPTYCVYASNIAHAWPQDLYSDEIGIVSSGTAIEAIPGGVLTGSPATYTPGTASDVSYAGLDAPKGLIYGTATSMNPQWFWNYFLNFTPFKSDKTNKLRIYGFGGSPYCVTNSVGSCPMGTASESWYWDAVGYPATLGVNPQGLGSAQQTYANPQVTGRQPVQWADVSSALTTTGPGGATVLQTLYNAVNQTQGWSGISASDVLYMTNDSSSYITAQASGNSSEITSVYFTWNGALGNMKSGLTENWASELPTTPAFAFLVGRPWWTGASSAATYSPPSPANWAIAQ